jgi:5'-3' exonuclease
MASLVRLLADAEDGGMAHADKHFYDRCRWASRTPSASRDPEDYPVFNPMPPLVRPGIGSAWRLRYYHYVFGASDALAVRAACISFLAGVAWSLCYMEQRCMSHGWYYPHIYAPTALDMCSLLLDTDLPREVDALMDDHLHPQPHPDWQLLMVLPPSSASLIPDEGLRRVMLDPGMGCIHMFPRRFKVATYMRDKLWECAPLLPLVEVGAIRKAVGKLGL